MSQCEQYQEWISRIVDGDLTAAEERELQAHVKTCPECAALYKAFSALSAEIQTDLEDVPLDLRESVMAEVRREEIRRRNRIPSILRGVMSVAACAAIVVGVYLGVSLTKGDGRLISAVSQSTGGVQESKAAAPAEAVPAAPATGGIASVMPSAASQPELHLELPAMQENGADVKSFEMPAEDKADTTIEEAAGEPAMAEEAAPEPTPEIIGEDWELSGWDLSLLRSLLKGGPTDLHEEEMQDFVLGRIHLQSGSGNSVVELYELDGTLYYRDPAEGTIYRAELTVEELRTFFEA